MLDSASGASNNLQNCHLDKTYMANSSKYLLKIICFNLFRYNGYVRDPESEDGTSEDDADGGSVKNKAAIVLFASNKGINLFRTADEVFIDGTFATAPDPFGQIVFVQV